MSDTMPADTATAEPAATPLQPHLTLTVPVLDWGKHRAIGQRITRSHDEPEAALKPELWSLVFEYGERCCEDELVTETNMMWATVDGLAAHLPDQAPMLRCLAQHVFESDFGHSDGYGLLPVPEATGGLSNPDRPYTAPGGAERVPGPLSCPGRGDG